MNQNLPRFNSDVSALDRRPLSARGSAGQGAFDVVAIVASAGGLKAVIEVLSELPSNFPAAVILVQHLQRDRKSLLVEILNLRTPLQVKQAETGDRLQPSIVYVAPPDYHLLVCAGGTLRLSQSPILHFVRPAADRLLESLAQIYRERAIAVVLTGRGIDGTDGVIAIKRMGGKVIAQNQASSAYFGMPGSAIHTGSVDWILPLSEVAATLVRLVME